MAGFDIALAVEYDNHAVACYKLNFPDTKIYHGDIAKLSVDKIFEITGLKQDQLDILDGSPPCQGFSTAGKRQLSDSRNQLFREYCRILKGLRPKVFVMENVSGLVKSRMKLIFANILNELKTCGYIVRARLLNTKYFGVPQSRERIIFIGTREDLCIDPSYPSPTKTNYLKKIDSRKAKYSRQRYGDVIAKNIAPTVTRIGRLFWNNSEEFGLKSYLYASGFPVDFRLAGSFTANKARIGNSVPPLFMKAIADHIRINILDKYET